MTERFLKFIDTVLKHEGGYINDPDDAGGETKYGISQKSYPDLDIKSLDIETAKMLYYRHYWNSYYDLILDEKLAFKLFDLGVNCGTTTVIKKLQLALKILNKEVVIDGSFGEATLNATNAEKHVYSEFIVQMELYYNKIALKNNNKKYLKGWLKRLYHLPSDVE